MTNRRVVTQGANGDTILYELNEHPVEHDLFLRVSSVGCYVFVDAEGYMVTVVRPDQLARAAALLNEAAFDLAEKSLQGS